MLDLWKGRRFPRLLNASQGTGTSDALYNVRREASLSAGLGGEGALVCQHCIQGLGSPFSSSL